MKSILLIIILYSLSLSAFSQYLPDISATEKRVIKDIKKSAKRNSFKYINNNLDDTLVSLIMYDDKNIEIKHTFNLEFGYCDYQEINYDCHPCAEEYSHNILETKYMKWVKIDENKYMSSYFWQTEMEIIKSNGNCVQIIYRYIPLEKKEYKVKYDKFAKLK